MRNQQQLSQDFSIHLNWQWLLHCQAISSETQLRFMAAQTQVKAMLPWSKSWNSMVPREALRNQLVTWPSLSIQTGGEVPRQPKSLRKAMVRWWDSQTLSQSTYRRHCKHFRSFRSGLFGASKPTQTRAKTTLPMLANEGKNRMRPAEITAPVTALMASPARIHLRGSQRSSNAGQARLPIPKIPNTERFTGTIGHNVALIGFLPVHLAQASLRPSGPNRNNTSLHERLITALNLEKFVLSGLFHPLCSGRLPNPPQAHIQTILSHLSEYPQQSPQLRLW